MMVILALTGLGTEYQVLVSQELQNITSKYYFPEALTEITIAHEPISLQYLIPSTSISRITKYYLEILIS